MGGQAKIGNVMLGRDVGDSVAITLSGDGVVGCASGRGFVMAREEQASTPLSVHRQMHRAQASSRTRILRLRLA